MKQNKKIKILKEFTILEKNTNKTFKVMAYSFKHACKLVSWKMGIYPSEKEFTQI